ncbi:MAG: ATP-binding protein [Acidimicrobiales bacterium]
MEPILELEIPARPEYIAIVRLVVSSVASTRRNLPDDRIDDLKLAVSEACTNAIEAYGSIPGPGDDGAHAGASAPPADPRAAPPSPTGPVAVSPDPGANGAGAPLHLPVGGRVRILVQDDDEKLEIKVADSGPGFDPDDLPAHPPVTDPERLNFERGLGIPLIRTLVDEVEFASSSAGTSVRMAIYGDPSELHPPEDLTGDDEFA